MPPGSQAHKREETRASRVQIERRLQVLSRRSVQIELTSGALISKRRTRPGNARTARPLQARKSLPLLAPNRQQVDWIPPDEYRINAKDSRKASVRRKPVCELQTCCPWRRSAPIRSDPRELRQSSGQSKGRGPLRHLARCGRHRRGKIVRKPGRGSRLAVGAIADRVVAIDGQPAVRSMMTLTLSCDHRVVDGARGAQFLNDLAKAIAEPQKHLR